MKKTRDLFISYVVPLILVGVLVGMVVFSTVLQEKRNVTYDYQSDVSSISMNKKVIRVATDIDYAPFSFVDENNNPSGHDIELIYAIARREGYNIQLSMIPWHEALIGLENEEYDVLISGDYSAGGNNVIFSTPICTDPFGIYGRNGSRLPVSTSDLKHYNIAALKSGSAKDIYVSPLKIEDSVTYYDTITDAFKAVDSGEMDFVISSNYTARHTISTNNLKMTQLGSTIYENAMCFMVSKNNEQLLKDINKSIVVFQSNGYMDDLSNKWFENYQPDITFKSLIDQNKTLFILILAVVILVIYTLLFMLTQLNKQKEKMMAEVSQVTGLPNLNAFRRIAEERINNDPGEEYVIARMDIDHFKLYNDIYGTDAGDRLLYSVGQKALARIKKSRIEVLLGHVTGDHFVFMQRATDFSPIRLYNACLKDLNKIDPNYNFAVRIGYCRVNDSNVDVAVYCDWAYLALKSIKGDYIRHWAEYDKSMRQQIVEEREITDEMADALSNGQFIPYFQPQYNFQTNKISGAEVLVRWKHPKKGMISPGKFIPVFEKNGFIYEMDKYIWRQACRFIKTAQEEGINLPSLSINISRRDLYRDDLLATLNALVREYGIDKKKLHLEITESAYTENPELLINVVTELGKDGYIIEMDDFGAGYSSLSILKDLPVNIVKLDMVFLNSSSTVGKTGNILSSVVHMAHQINLSVIAEGVETAQQARFLHSIGCYHMQGYLFAKPMDEEAFSDYVKKIEFDLQKIQSAPQKDISVDFLDDRTQESLLFNSFIGSACIMEKQGSHINILRVNDRFFKELGIDDRADFDMLNDLSSRLDEQSLNIFDKMVKEAIETGNEVTGELFIQPVENNQSEGTWIFLRARYLAQKGDSFLFFCSVENISEKRKLTRNNEIILNELNNVISNLPGGIARFKYDGRIIFEYMSPGFAHLRGYSVDELIEKLNRNVADDIHPDDAERLEKLIISKVKSAGEFNATYRVRKKDGTYIWVNTHGLSESIDDNSSMIYLYSADVSDEKAVEEKLLKNEVTLSNIMASVSGGTATIEFDGQGFKLVEVSESISKILDKTKEEFRYAIEHDLESLLYEQDAEKVFNSIITGAKTGKDTDITFRVVKDSEEPVWVRMHVRYEKTKNGVLAHVLFRDISSVSELYQSVINETDTGIVVIDKNTHETIFANRAGAAVFEMLPETLIGKQCYEYCWGKDVHCGLWTDNLPPEGLTIEDEHDGRHYIVHRKAITWNGIDAIITYYSDRTQNYEADTQFSRLISNIPCGLSIIEHDGSSLKRTYLSDYGKKLLDVDDMGRIASRYPQDDKTFVYSDDFNNYIETLNTSSKENKPFTIELRVVFRDGSIHWIELNGQPFYHQENQKQFIFLTFSDISRRKSLDEEANLREEEYCAAANQSNRMICRYIIPKRAISVLKNVSEKYDSVTYMENAPEEFIKQGYIAKESEEAWRQLFDKIERGDDSGEVKNISIATASDRIFRWYDASFKAIQTASGRPEIAILSFEDITERKLKDRNSFLAYKSVLKALSSVYPVCVVCNASRNTYRLLENENYIVKTIYTDGTYDNLISKVTDYIPNEEQRTQFYKSFSSIGIISSWNEGKDRITFEHQQLDDSGKAHWMETIAIRVPDPEKKDYLHVLVSQIVDERKNQNEANTTRH